MFPQATAILVGELAVIGNEGPPMVPMILPFEVFSDFSSHSCGEAMRDAVSNYVPPHEFRHDMARPPDVIKLKSLEHRRDELPSDLPVRA
jgi:hypothetical protein